MMIAPLAPEAGIVRKANGDNLLNLVLPCSAMRGVAILARAAGRAVAEHAIEVGEAVEAAGETDVGDAQVGFGQQALGLFDPA